MPPAAVLILTSFLLAQIDDLLNGGIEVKLDSFRTENFPDRIGQIQILFYENLGCHVHHADFTSQPAKCLGHFNSDGAASKHNDRLRQAVQV